MTEEAYRMGHTYKGFTFTGHVFSYDYDDGHRTWYYMGAVYDDQEKLQLSVRIEGDTHEIVRDNIKPHIEKGVDLFLANEGGWWETLDLRGKKLEEKHNLRREKLSEVHARVKSKMDKYMWPWG